MNGGLRSKSRLRKREEVNPLDGVINIVDAMLVFACGLMLALIINWDLDLNDNLSQKVNLSRGQEVTNMDRRNDLLKAEGVGTFYEKMGTVYKDPETGKLFMLTDE